MILSAIYGIVNVGDPRSHFKKKKIELLFQFVWWIVSRLWNCSRMALKLYRNKLSDFYGTCGTVPSFSLSLSLSFPPFLSSLTCWSEFLRNSWNASWKPSWKPTGLWLFMDNSRRAALSKSTTFQHEIDIKLENESNPRQKGSTHSFLFKKKK